MIYIFKVKLYYDKRTWRTIAIKDTQSLGDLHDAIFKAFDRHDEHLYSFYMTNGVTRKDRYRNCPEYSHPMSIQGEGFAFREPPKNAEIISISDLNLTIKGKFEYLFDFGDEWLHEIVLEKIEEPISKETYPKILKVNGESPNQYPDHDEDDY